VTVTNAITTSYNLTTTYFTQFVWVNDTLGNSLGAAIVNGTLNASCNNVPMINSLTGYFRMNTSTCASNLVICNTLTNAVLFTSAAPTSYLFTVVLNRFLFPTIRF
jgi:hypothetical protein